MLERLARFELQHRRLVVGGWIVLTETLVGGVGALVILLFAFGTLPAVAMPLMIAGTAIVNTFTPIWALTYLTSVSLIVQFLVALVGLGVAIDYALLMIFRFREGLARGEDVELNPAAAQAMALAGNPKDDGVVGSHRLTAAGISPGVLEPRRHHVALVEAFPAVDAAAKPAQATISDL